MGALDRLPSSFRTAFLLATLGELQYEEIAEMTGCPVGTVRSRIARARRLLRDHLERTAA